LGSAAARGVLFAESRAEEPAHGDPWEGEYSRVSGRGNGRGVGDASLAGHGEYSRVSGREKSRGGGGGDRNPPLEVDWAPLLQEQALHARRVER